jgi:uncharacterized protein involved in outer membrane biogenesis
MRILKRILLGLFIIILLIGVTGFFIAPYFARPILVEKLSAQLKRPVAIKKISINPFAASLSVKGFSVGEKTQSTPLISWEEAYVNVHVTSSVLRRAVILEEIRLDGLYVGIARNENGSYNFSDLIPAAETKPAPEGKPLGFSLNNIQVTGGKIDFHDEMNKTKHTVRDMQLSIPFVSNIEYYVKHYVEPKYSAKINGHAVEIAGKTRPFLSSRETTLDIDIKDIDVPYYLKYVPVKMNFKLPSAHLDIKLKVAFILPKDKSPSLKVSGDLALRNLLLNDLNNQKILKIPVLQVSVAELAPFTSDIHLAAVSLQAPELVVKRDKAGDLNLQKLLAPQEKKQNIEKPVEKQVSKKVPVDDKKKLKLKIDNFNIDAADITFIDASPAEAARIHIAPLQLRATNLSTEKGVAGSIELAFKIDKKGEAAVKGSLGLEPLNADLSVSLKNIAIRLFQPYFSDKIKINVTNGAIITAGNLSYAPDKEGKPVIQYAGNIAVANLVAVDKAQSNDFLKWKQLYFNQLKAGFNPFFLNIKGISLTDYYAKIVINQDGTTNIQNIFGGGEKDKKEQGKSAAVSAQEKEKPAKAAPSEPLKNISIGQITFQGGTIDFTDKKIQPNYSVHMLNMGGSIAGMSSAEISRARVDLKGNLGYGSPVAITGTINPLLTDIFADIKISFKDIELSPATPYSSTYLGYPITKGKLSFDVSYFIEKRKLRAENKVHLDQLAFGEKVESPQAIKAPVTLAVSLLTDRNGQINLDIPVSGSLDDPEFSVWPIVWQVIKNLITKALTSPFALLASLGGGEELSYLEFEYGSAVLTEKNTEKIKKLAKALQERPKLKLDIEGYVSLENDKAGLKTAGFQRKLKEQKLKDLTGKGEQAPPLGEIQIEPREYEKYLTLAYRASEFVKPRTALGVQKLLPVQEMEKLLLASIDIKDNDLRQLAARRSQQARELLLKSGDIAAARIFIVQQQDLTPEKKEKLKDSRVNFKLK